MPSILQNKENADMEEHCSPGGERDAGVHSTICSHWVEEPYLRELDGEVGQEDEFRAVPLLGGSGDLLPLNLVLVEVGDAIDDDPGNTAPEVDAFVHNEGHDSGGEDIVLHIRVPGLYCV